MADPRPALTPSWTPSSLEALDADDVEQLQLFYGGSPRYGGEPQQPLSTVLAVEVQTVHVYHAE